MASIIKADNGVSSGVTGIVQTADSSGQLALQTTTSGGTATTALTIDNSQKVTFANSIGFGSNAGITFNNSSALTNSTLNDYEIGTWSANLSNNGYTGSWTIVQAYYQKIGQMVTCWVTFDGGTSGSGSGSLLIQNLPFTPYGVTDWHCSGSWSASNGGNGSVVWNGTSQTIMYIWSGGGTVTTSGITFLTACFTYKTTF